MGYGLLEYENAHETVCTVNENGLIASIIYEFFGDEEVMRLAPGGVQIRYQQLRNQITVTIILTVSDFEIDYKRKLFKRNANEWDRQSFECRCFDFIVHHLADKVSCIWDVTLEMQFEYTSGYKKSCIRRCKLNDLPSFERRTPMYDFCSRDVTEIIKQDVKGKKNFTVFWSDGTHTTVTLLEGQPDDDYTAFLYALGKKLFGNKGEARKFIEKKKQAYQMKCEAKTLRRKQQNKKKQEEQLWQ